MTREYEPDPTVSLVVDRVAKRHVSLDLTSLAKVRGPKNRPANRKRQKIVRFEGREGDIESFSIAQTVPYCGYEGDCPPSQLQYGAVINFFNEPCETRYQASLMLTARDYAEAVVRGQRFTGDRRAFVWLCATAFILSDTDTRARVKSWKISKHGDDISAGIAWHRCYRRVSSFTEKLVDDMRGCGSLIFG